MDHGLGTRYRPTSRAPRRGVSGDPVVLGAIPSRDRNQFALAGRFRASEASGRS